MSTPTKLFLIAFTFIFWSVLIYSCVATRKDAVQNRVEELRATGLFPHPSSGVAALEAERALYALERPLLGPDTQKARQTNLEALARLCR